LRLRRLRRRVTTFLFFYIPLAGLEPEFSGATNTEFCVCGVCDTRSHNLARLNRKFHSMTCGVPEAPENFASAAFATPGHKIWLG